MRLATIAVTLALLAGAAGAQGLGAAAERERRRRAAAAAEWLEFQDPRGAYVVRLPVKPVERTVQVPGSGGATMTGYFADTGTRAYSVGYHEEPAESVAKGAPAVLASMRDGFLKGTGGVLDGEKAVTLGAHPGSEIAVREAGLAWRVRFYLVGRRVYGLTTCARQAEHEAEAADRFFASFSLRP